jgi:Ser/Thr protein kinase RdoA (MazF antagonist)
MQQSLTPTAAIADDLREASHVFFPSLSDVAAVPGHPHLVSVTTPSGDRRVRRLPETTLLEDLAFSHDVMTRAREAGIAAVPHVVAPPDGMSQSALRLGSRLYDAQSWMPGDPSPRAISRWPGEDDRIDIPVVLDATPFAEVIAATAKLHEATQQLATRRDIPTAPLAMLPGAVRQAHARHLGVLRGRARQHPAIQRWLATGERLLAGAEPIVLAATEDRVLDTSVLHLDLWPAHVLLGEGRLSGLLGWDRVAAGSPLLDIAQATLRLHGWSDDAVETAIATYSETRPLSPDERRLLPAVAALDAVATTGRLLEQTYAVPETARPPSALRAAIDMMLGSMTALDRGLAAQATAGKRQRAPWRHAPRREGGKPRDRRPRKP